MQLRRLTRFHPNPTLCRNPTMEWYAHVTYASILGASKDGSLMYQELRLPKEPRVHKRRHVIGEYGESTHIATAGVQGDFPADDGKDKAAQNWDSAAVGRGPKRLSARRRKEISQKAAATCRKN